MAVYSPDNTIGTAATPAHRFSVGNRAIDRVLDLYACSSPISACRAAEALTKLLDGINQSAWQEVSWVFSRLTGDGFPVEFSFSSAGETINYACEVAGPEMDNARRLTVAENLLTKLGAGALPQPLAQHWLDIQHSANLLYGTWIGGRHDPEEDRYKVYLEVPRHGSAVAHDLVRKYAQVGWLPGEGTAHLRMLGYDLNTGRTEFYFRLKKIEAWEIGATFKYYGMPGCADHLIRFIEEISERPFSSNSLGTNLGFSLSFDSEGTLLAFSLFAFARSVFRGGDGDIRRSLLGHGERLGWNLQTYRKVSEPLASHVNWKTHHGMTTFTVAPNGKTALQVGLRPPAE